MAAVGTDAWNVCNITGTIGLSQVTLHSGNVVMWKWII